METFEIVIKCIIGCAVFVGFRFYIACLIEKWSARKGRKGWRWEFGFFFPILAAITLAWSAPNTPSVLQRNPATLPR